jgi:hypothetical protein
MGDTSEATTEVTAALPVEGSQADSSSSSAPSLVLENEKPSLLTDTATEPGRRHPRSQNPV